MAELDVGKLSLTIEADGKAAIAELSRVKEAAEGASSDAMRAYQDAGREMAEAFEPVAEAAEETADGVKEVGEEAQKMGDAVKTAGTQASKSMKDMLDSADRLGSTLSATVTAPLIALYGAMVNGASDLTETIGKSEVVFEDQAEKVFAWSEGAIENMGLAEASALDFAATFGDMGKGMDVPIEKATEMSMNLTQLSADLASFKNLSADRAAQALTGVYTGETEALKSLGIVMTQANLQAFALSQGIATQVSAMSQAEQVMLRYQYVMAKTADAQGDFVRTGGNLANQGRALVQTIKQASNSFGEILTPAVTEAVSTLREGAQYVAELDDGTKTIILSIGGAVAAVGPLIVAGTKVLKLVTALKTAMTASAFGPAGIVVAGIAAAAAGGVALYNVLNDTNNAIDTTSAKFQRLKGIVGGGVDVSVNADTDELDGLDGKTVMMNIDANGQLALEKAQAILNELGSEEYTGTLTIDGDPQKAQEALNGLEAAVQAMLAGEGSVAELQAAIDACEELEISPDMDEEKRAEVQGKLDSLMALAEGLKNINVSFSVKEADYSEPDKWEQFHAKLKELGWETKEYTAIGKFEVDEMAISNAAEYKQALVDAAAATKDYEDAVSNLNSLLDQNLAEQVAQINAAAAEQADYQTRLFNSGIIDEETYNANVKAIIDGAAKTTEELERQYEMTKQLNEQYNNGLKADDYTVTAQQFLTLSGGATLTDEDYQGAVAKLEEARRLGEDMTQYQTEAMIVNHQLAQQAVADYQAMTAAQQQYDQAVADADAQKAAAEQAIKDTEMLQLAIEAYASSYNSFFGSGEDTLANANEVLTREAEEMGYGAEKIAELQAQLQGYLTGENGLMTGVEAAEEYGSGELMGAVQAEYEQAIADAETAKTTAAETFASTLNALTGEFTAAETQMLLEMTQSTGAAISQADAEMIGATEALIDQMGTALAEGGPEVAGEASGMIESISNQVDARPEGAEVGSAITAGITAGLSNGTGMLYKKARAIVNTTIAEMKRTAEVNSPSKKSAREIGAPIMEGVGFGAEKETPNVVKTIKRSVEHVISGAAQVVNHGFVTLPAIAPQTAQIDYDRMGEAMTGAVSALKLAVDIDGKRAATIMREDTARQQAMREREIGIGRGRIG